MPTISILFFSLILRRIWFGMEGFWAEKVWSGMPIRLFVVLAFETLIFPVGITHAGSLSYTAAPRKELPPWPPDCVWGHSTEPGNGSGAKFRMILTCRISQLYLGFAANHIWPSGDSTVSSYREERLASLNPLGFFGLQFQATVLASMMEIELWVWMMKKRTRVAAPLCLRRLRNLKRKDWFQYTYFSIICQSIGRIILQVHLT